jgi:DNA-binding transcriptional LysR family regulator
MNIESLQIFCLVFEEQSISRAAQLSFISQPSVTRQIKALEDFYGNLLFHRKAYNITATEAGQALYPIAKAIINDFQYSIDTMKRINGERQFKLRVGASLIIGEYLLPKLLGMYKKKYPESQLFLKIIETGKVLESLIQDEIHIGFVEGKVDQKEFETKVFMEDELVLIAPPNHPWSKREMIEISELRNEKLIRRHDTSETRKMMEKVFKKNDFFDKLESFMEMDTTQAIKTAVESELGVAMISRMAVEKELKEGRLTEVKIKDIQLTRPLYMVKRRSRFPHEGTEKLIKLLEKNVKKLN